MLLISAGLYFRPYIRIVVLSDIGLTLPLPLLALLIYTDNIKLLLSEFFLTNAIVLFDFPLHKSINSLVNKSPILACSR